MRIGLKMLVITKLNMEILVESSFNCQGDFVAGNNNFCDPLCHNDGGHCTREGKDDDD